MQLDFLDGLRAVLALYIVMHHLGQLLGQQAGPYRVFAFGQGVVAIFITISGFCLAIPQASTRNWSIDAKAFFRRRVRRILPPYYAALLLAILLSWLYAWLDPPSVPLGELTFAAVGSHLLLAQNWFPSLMFVLDGPLWSIAVECQIYLLYPLIVFCCRRLTPFGMLLFVGPVSALVFRVFRGNGQPQFLCFFALGVVSANIAFSKKTRWRALAIALLSAVMLLFRNSSLPQSEAYASLGSAAFIVYLAQTEASSIRKALSWRPIAWVGTFSYSIYLIHALVVAAGWYILRKHDSRFGTGADAKFLAFTLTVAAISLLLSYGFHIAFERPFMSVGRQRTERRLAE